MAGRVDLLSRFSRLSICGLGLNRSSIHCQKACTRHISTQKHPLEFWASPVLCSEPMKRKKKLNPGISMEKEKKKRKKIEKAIKKIEIRGRNLKPIEEIEGDRVVLKTREQRLRDKPAKSFEQSEDRALLFKDWSKFKRMQYIDEQRAITTAIDVQYNALQSLREESEELYQKAIQLDSSLLPFHRKGPLNTPPIDNYDSPDGDYIDTQRVFDK